MILLAANIYLVGSAIFVGGALLGYWLLVWKDRNLRATHVLQKESVLDAARREAETLLREARLQANEEALKFREQTEKSFAARRLELAETEARLTEREKLINRQLESLMQEEGTLHAQQAELQKIQRP